MAITLAGLWAVSTFWYREQYVPQNYQPSVVARATAEKLGESSGLVSLRFKAVLENRGKAGARVLGVSLTATGHRIVPHQEDGGLSPPPLGVPITPGSWKMASSSVASKPVLLENYGTVIERFENRYRFQLDPDDTFEEEHFLVIPRGDLAYVRVSLAIHYVNAAFPARAGCYGFERGPLGEARLVVRKDELGACSLYTTEVEATVSLW